MIDQKLIHFGFIKFISLKGFGFVVDFIDNSEYYFHLSYFEIAELSDIIVTFNIRKSLRHPDKYEAYSLKNPSVRKKELLIQFNSFPKEIQEIISLFIPSILYKTNFDNYYHEVYSLIKKYDSLISEIYNYVKSFDFEKFLNSFYVKTYFYYSASTKDWDINELSYMGYIGEPYIKLKSIYNRCNSYEESLVREYSEIDKCYPYDDYLDSISYKNQVIKSTTAYGYDRYFWNDLDKDEIESLCPQLAKKWKEEISQTYNKENHFRNLIKKLQSKFNSLIKRIPMLVNSKGELVNYINSPYIDVLIYYPNGETHFQSTYYTDISYKWGGYKLTRFFNGKKFFTETRDLEVVDSDFIELKNQINYLYSKSNELFRDIVEKYISQLDK